MTKQRDGIVIGEQFLEGEVWTGPRGGSYRVISVRTVKGHYKPVARLRTNSGRIIWRFHDEVIGWVRNSEQNDA